MPLANISIKIDKKYFHEMQREKFRLECKQFGFDTSNIDYLIDVKKIASDSINQMQYQINDMESKNVLWEAYLDSNKRWNDIK